MPVLPGGTDEFVTADRTALYVWVGQAIRQARQAKGYSRRSLAWDLGVSEKTLLRMERGLWSSDLYLLGRIAELCSVPLVSLVPISLESCREPA